MIHIANIKNADETKCAARMVNIFSGPGSHYTNDRTGTTRMGDYRIIRLYGRLKEFDDQSGKRRSKFENF